MKSRQGGIFSSPEPIFGVCEALGRDFRISPMIFRLAFGVGLVLNPLIAAGTYVGLAVLVLASRLLFPDVRKDSAEASAPARVEVLPAATDRAAADVEQPELARAA